MSLAMFNLLLLRVLPKMSNDITFNKLWFSNFLSFGQNVNEIDLSQPSTVLVEGKNLDTGGSNGSGKCVTYDAMITIRDKTTKELFTMKIGEFHEMIASKNES